MKTGTPAGIRLASACIEHLETCAVCKRRLDDLAAKGQTPEAVKQGAKQLLSEPPAEEKESVAAREQLLKSLALRCRYLLRSRQCHWSG
jgi:hypothetical protein